MTENKTAIAKIVGANLKRLIAQNKITQSELCTALGVAPASMSEFCNGSRLPGADFFVKLKELYNIKIDDFLTKSSSGSTLSETSPVIMNEPEAENTYEKYCGLYLVYYFDTGRYKGRDNQVPKESVTYGLLYLYKITSVLGVNEYRSAALLGIENREEAEDMLFSLYRVTSEDTVINTMETSENGNTYHGGFEMSQDHVFIDLEHGNTDKAHLITHRVETNKGNYKGGIGTVNSISRGRERAPVIQYIGLSRNRLHMSVEEIHHSLLLGTPNINAEAETEELIKTFKALYVDPGVSLNEFTEYQKSVMVRSLLERYIRKNLERNMFRYGKVSVNDDDEWYQAIKDA